jgi:outer membrane immunogenic protein
MKKLVLAAVASVVLAAGPAVAADLGRKAPAYIPPPAPPPPTFTGCYVNGGAGYGLWNIDHSAEFLGQQISTETTSGGRGWLGRVGGGCDYQFGAGTGFWSNWVVGAFADFDFMDLHKNFQSTVFPDLAGEAKEKDAWAVGGRIGYLVTPNVFTYWDGGYTETRFDQINLNGIFGDGDFGSIGSHTYHGWFVGGGYEIGLSGFFGLPVPAGLFWRTEYRYSSFNSADLPISFDGVPTNFSEHMRPFVQTITTSLVWKFNWWGH